MKYIYVLLPLILLVLSACSSDNDEPQINYSYFGEFTEFEEYQTADEESISPEQKIQFLIDNGVPYDENYEILIYPEPKAKQTITSYNLNIDGNFAYMQIDEIENEIYDRIQADVIRYKFSPGLYEVEKEEVPSGYHYVIYVTPYEARFEYRLIGGNASVGSPLMTIELINSGYKLLKNKEVLDEGINPLNKNSNYLNFTVTKDSNATLNLKDGLYAFSFVTTTGQLTQLSPEYKEIGNLIEVK